MNHFRITKNFSTWLLCLQEHIRIKFSIKNLNNCNTINMLATLIYILTVTRKNLILVKAILQASFHFTYILPTELNLKAFLSSRNHISNSRWTAFESYPTSIQWLFTYENLTNPKFWRIVYSSGTHWAIGECSRIQHWLHNQLAFCANFHQLKNRKRS